MQSGRQLGSFSRTWMRINVNTEPSLEHHIQSRYKWFWVRNLIFLYKILTQIEYCLHKVLCFFWENCEKVTANSTGGRSRVDTNRQKVLFLDAPHVLCPLLRRDHVFVRIVVYQQCWPFSSFFFLPPLVNLKLFYIGSMRLGQWAQYWIHGQTNTCDGRRVQHNHLFVKIHCPTHAVTLHGGKSRANKLIGSRLQ